MRRINSLPCETAVLSIIIEFNHEILVITFWRTIGTAEGTHEKTMWFEKETHSHIKFYHNWAISSVLIGWQLCLINYSPWKWCDSGIICFSLSRMHVSWETSTKWTSNLSTLWQKTILQQFSTVCTSYQHQNVQKFAVKPLAIPLEFWTCWRHFYGR